MAVRHSRPGYAHFIRRKHETSANGTKRPRMCWHMAAHEMAAVSTNHPRLAQIIRKQSPGSLLLTRNNRSFRIKMT